MASKNPDAIAMLKQDHRKVEDLFEQFSKARSSDRKEALVQSICTELMVHTMIEEEIFYPALRGMIEDDILDEAHVEHDGAKMLIADLLGSTPDAPFYDAKVMVQKEEIRHHVKEEEKSMFSQARAAKADLRQLAEELSSLKEELTAKFKKQGLPTPITRSLEAAPKIEVGRPVA